MAAQLTAEDAMAHPVVCLPAIVSVEELVAVLRSCAHNGFPVVSDLDDHRTPGQLEGLINRKHLTTLLARRAFHKRDDEVPPALSWTEMEASYPRFPTLDEAERALDGEDDLASLVVDLRPYMHRTPACIHRTAPLSRAFRIARLLGARHMIVVDDHQVPVGILTRHDLVMDNLRALMRTPSRPRSTRVQ